MPKVLPPIEHRYSKTNPPPHHTQKGPYLTCILKRLLEKSITYKDPETKKKILGCLKDDVMLALILEGRKGNVQAIKEIFERIEGKVKEDGDQRDSLTEKKIVLIFPKEVRSVLGERFPEKITL